MDDSSILHYKILPHKENYMKGFKDYKISKKVMVTCGPCLKGDHEHCTPLTPIKKVTCLCAFTGHKNLGRGGRPE